MKKQQFLDPMHPAAEHNYAIDFADLLQGIGGDAEVITGTPVVTVVNTPPTGFTATLVGLDSTSRKVIFTAGVSTPNHEAAAYKGKGAPICIQVVIASTSSVAEVQQAELIVNDQCLE